MSSVNFPLVFLYLWRNKLNSNHCLRIFYPECSILQFSVQYHRQGIYKLVIDLELLQIQHITCIGIGTIRIEKHVGKTRMFLYDFTFQGNLVHIKLLQRQFLQTGMFPIAQHIEVTVEQHISPLAVIHAHTIRTLHEKSIRSFLYIIFHDLSN